ncbi:MAG: GTPase [Rhodospirillaceae bacterium]|jgi:predicted GTPase|nr:GTPase [Rhodospirillaceae bacterium]MBT5666860.1 GTPase [Rhodospirillaceae bacterium]
MPDASHPVRTLILGAAGRDFHNFNVVYRDDPDTRVVAFTAAQIPGISNRPYPASLAGPLYPNGVPILDEIDLDAICRRDSIERVVFAYSDVPHATVMHAASRALSAGADFVLLGPDRTMLTAPLPVIAISSVRTGCGKSQVGRWLSRRLRARNLNVGVLRHPMPYGDLARQSVQRFANRADLADADCTIEEREEYEPHIEAGGVIYAGVDYEAIVTAAADAADLILWEGGNNDFPFVAPDLHIVLVDALRPDQLTSHHPGETVLRMADVVVVAKANAAQPGDAERMADAARRIAGDVPIVQGASLVRLDAPQDVNGKRALIVEDGPTITHGGMPHGAGYNVVRSLGNAIIVDPRESASPLVRDVYDRYPHIGPVLPAIGYDAAQRGALADTINASAADVVVAATPVDIAAILDLNKPVVRAHYDYADRGEPTLSAPTLGAIVDQFLDERKL